MTIFTIIGVIAVLVALFYFPRTAAVILLGIILVSVMGFNAVAITIIFIFLAILAFITDMDDETYKKVIF